jgi:hypothetical protein
MAINFSAKDAAAGQETVNFLQETESLYREAAAQLFSALKGVKQGRIDDAKGASNAVRDLRQAIEWVMDERNRVDKLRKQAAGAVGAGELDFSVARDEIGRRLACLRAAAGH